MGLDKLFKSTLVVIAMMCVAALAQPAASTATTSATTKESVAPGKAVVVALRGEIDDYNKTALVKRFEDARRYGADTVIVKIDTYGGLVTSGLEISGFIKRQNDLHVIAYVNEKAISAGAMIAIACNEIVMQPGARLGDCAPIVMAPSGNGLETIGASERAKMESPILQDFYDSAIRNGYDPLLVQSMVSVGRVVHWIENSAGERKFVDDKDYKTLTDAGWKPVAGVRDPIDSGDELLTVGSELAQKLGLAKAIEASPETLAATRGLNVLANLEPSGGENLIQFLSSGAVRTLLTVVFLLGIYLCFSYPGHGMAEVLVVSTLAVLVGVPLLTGYAQWWEIFAILIGLVLLALEVFVIPGFGFAGISGIVLVLFGLTMTWVGNEPIGIPGTLPKLAGTWAAIQQGLLVVTSGMICSLVLWVWLQRYLPKLPYFNKLILTTTSGSLSVNGSDSSSTPSTVNWPAIGSRGRAATDLRPGGSAAFHDPTLNDARMTDVISDSGFVRNGTEVVVREVQGNRVVVRAAT